jgi:hypothetical protein
VGGLNLVLRRGGDSRRGEPRQLLEGGGTREGGGGELFLGGGVQPP